MASAELQAIIDMLRARPRDVTPTLQEMRATTDSIMSVFPVATDVSVTPVTAGGVAAEWVDAPGVDRQRVILYLHGGGYVVGSLDSHRDLASRISRAAAARVLTADYRLAPEHPFPAAVEDAVAAYRWLVACGFPPSRVAVAGDSAGGGLTVAALTALRDAGEPRPAAGICLSPWTDLAASGDSMHGKAALDPMVRRDDLLALADLYLAGQDPCAPLASPIHAEMRGLPPLLIQVGTSETLLDDATRLAERARAAGVDVTLEPWEEMVHVWHIFAAILPEGQQAIERIGAFVRQFT